MKSSLIESAPLLRIAVSLMAGIAVGYYMQSPVPLFPIFAGMLGLTLFLWKYEFLQSLTIGLSVFLLGELMMERQRQAEQSSSWPPYKIRYEAVVLSDPLEKPKTVAVDVLVMQNQRRLRCYIYKDVWSRRLRVGDGLQLQSHIETNRYLATTYVARHSWRKIQLSLEGLSLTKRTRFFFLKLRAQLLRRIQVSESDKEQYAVVAAMVLGDKSALTREVKDLYAVTGASHVLALSGLHLGIIYTLLTLILGRGRWRVPSQLLTILGIWAFVFLVGMSVSVVRSAVMISTYALLSLGRRNRMSINVLAFAAVVILLFSPMSLFDVGFQLSFVAVFSIFTLQPLFDGIASPQNLIVRWCWAMLTVSLAAQIGVAPLLAYYFGRFSTYFLLTGFIVVPAATLILYLSPIAIAWPSLAYLLLYIAGWLNRLLGFVASLPGASIEGLHPTVLQVAMAYVIMAALCWLTGIIRRAGES